MALLVSEGGVRTIPLSKRNWDGGLRMLKRSDSLRIMRTSPAEAYGAIVNKNMDLEKSQYNEPYSYPWNKTIWNYTEVFFKHYIEILAYDHFENIAFDQQTVWRIL